MTELMSHMKIKSKDDNEDYCAVCLDGGELLCCDRCPKVFHIKCHMAAMKEIPKDADEWVCLFCTTKEDLDKITEMIDDVPAKYICFPEDKWVPDKDFIYICEFLSEIFKRKESVVVRGLFKKTFKWDPGDEPSHLNYIRARLTLQTPTPFGSPEEIILLLRKMLFQANAHYVVLNTFEYRKIMSDLEKAFNELLEEFYPEYMIIRYEPDPNVPPIKTN